MTKPLSVLAVLLAVVPASAGNIKLGGVAVTPYSGGDARYEHKISRGPNNIKIAAAAGGGVRGSWIMSNNLGLKLEAPIGERNKVKAMYDVTFENYKVQPRANNAINQKVGVGYEFKGSKLGAKLSNDYVNTQDPAFNPNGTVVNGSLVQRERRWQNTLAGEAEYTLADKFFAGVDAQTDRKQYLNRSGGAASLANTLNTSEQTFGVKGGYKVAPKTKVFAAVHRTLLHYTEETRQDNHRDWDVDFGVEGSLAPKLKGLVQAGFNYVQFDRDTANPTRATVSRHFQTLVKLDYAVTEKGTFVLAANRATNDSSTTGSRYFVTAGANLAYNHKFGKLSAGVNGGVQIDRYSDNITQGTETKTRRDDNYTAGAKVDYKIKDWASVGGSFTRNARFSTFSRQFNYRDNITAVNAKLSF